MTALVRGPGDRVLGEGETFLDVETADPELADPGIDRAALARISADTGVRVIDRSDPKSWEPLTSYEEVAVPREKTIDPWNQFALLILLSLLLGADWLLRLWRGFA